MEIGDKNDDSDKNNQEDLQIDNASGASTKKAPSDKIKPKSQLLRSTRQRTIVKGYKKLVNRSAISNRLFRDIK